MIIHIKTEDRACQSAMLIGRRGPFAKKTDSKKVKKTIDKFCLWEYDWWVVSGG
jgi:hypothetical protein